MLKQRPQMEVFAKEGDVLGEGPMWSTADHALYWVDIASRRLFRKARGDMEHQSWSLPDYPGCLAELAPGMVAIAMGDGLQRFEVRSAEIELLRSTQGRKVSTRFNDGKVDPLGRLWVGTMQNNFGPNGTSTTLDREDGVLYRFDADLSVHVMAESIGVPNSLAWSPDLKRFYFADSLRGQIFVYDFDAESGAIGNKRLFFDSQDYGIPDGSAIDVDGCLWNARWGAGALLRITPRGTVDRVVEVPVPQPTSCIFGGPGFNTLYVTSATKGLLAAEIDRFPLSGAVFSLEGLGQGMPVPPIAQISG